MTYTSNYLYIGSTERRNLIDKLRTEGNFIYNTQEVPEGRQKYYVEGPRINTKIRTRSTKFVLTARDMYPRIPSGVTTENAPVV